MAVCIKRSKKLASACCMKKKEDFICSISQSPNKFFLFSADYLQNCVFCFKKNLNWESLKKLFWC